MDFLGAIANTTAPNNRHLDRRPLGWVTHRPTSDTQSRKSDLLVLPRLKSFPWVKVLQPNLATRHKPTGIIAALDDPQLFDISPMGWSCYRGDPPVGHGSNEIGVVVDAYDLAAIPKPCCRPNTRQRLDHTAVHATMQNSIRLVQMRCSCPAGLDPVGPNISQLKAQVADEGAEDVAVDRSGCLRRVGRVVGMRAHGSIITFQRLARIAASRHDALHSAE